MILALSKAAFPSATLEDFTEAASRRGIAQIEAAAPAETLVLNAAREDVAMAYAAALLHGYTPRHITLRGGGPEAAFHEGRGIGALMARLALSGYTGVLLLEPSSDAALPVWRAWLNKGKSWGCGSKQQDASLVQIAWLALLVDVRTTEPKDRFEQIMSAYESLRVGESMHLVVDHDPKCMYYTLRATRGEEAFGFEYLEDGPETWQVVVRKKHGLGPLSVSRAGPTKSARQPNRQ